MGSGIARTLTAVSALVLGFGPALLQAADANNTPYTKYLDCGSTSGRTTAGGNSGCVERGEVLNFGQLRDILAAAAKYREESERRSLLPPSSDYSYTDGAPTLRPRINDSTTSYNSPTNPSSTIPARRQDASARSDEVVVRYERGINDQNNSSSRLVFTVKDETGESSSYSVNLSDEAGQYIEREIIGMPTTRSAAEVTAEETAQPLDMREVVVSQEMIPTAFNSEVVVSREAPIPVQISPSSQSTAVQVSSQTTTTISAQMQPAAPAPAPGQPTISYLPPQITIMESSVDSQPITVSYYTFNVEQQPVTATSYTFTTQGSTTSVSAEPVITVSLRPAQSSPDLTVSTTTLSPSQVSSDPLVATTTLRPAQDSSNTTVTTTTMTTTTAVANVDTVTVRPYVIMISPTETVHVVPQQIETSVNNVLAAVDQSVTPGENVRDQVEAEGRTTASFEDIGNAPAPSNNNDDDDDSPR